MKLKMKLAKEEQERVEKLQSEISRLKAEIQNKEDEIEAIYMKNGGSFENSYVLVDNEDGYNFMKVERQMLRSGGHFLLLKGLHILLSDNPLEMKDSDEPIDSLIYNEDGEVWVSISQVMGYSREIKKITKKDFETVIKYCRKLLNDKFLKDE